MNDSEKVLQFTKCSGLSIPNKPSSMNKTEVFFLVKMMLDEILELCATVADADESKSKIIELVSSAKSLDKIESDDDLFVASEQADALVDSYYYSLNASVKKGINLSKVFDIVHDANMSKRDPKTGLFIKNKEGKVLKPEGWKAPDVLGCIKEQFEKGSFE